MATKAPLLAKVTQIEALLAHCNQTLASPVPSKDSASPPPTPQNAPNPLHLLRDTAKLLRAHVTKIGLLVINEPFTPSAVQKELVACEKLCIPGMVGALEVCHPHEWTSFVAKEARLRVQAALSAFALLMVDVKSKAEGGSVKLDVAKHKEKTLVSTGQVWEACDALVALERQGLPHVVLSKAKEQEDMLKDALEELKEWSEDEDDQDEGFVAGSDDEADDEDDRDSTEDMFSGSRLPAHRKDIKELLATAFKQLKLVGMLFQALIKRRVKTFAVPAFEERARAEERSGRVARVDDMLVQMHALAGRVDELAAAFYELNAEQATAHLDALDAGANALADSMERSWDGSEDEFTAWSKKWEAAFGQATPEKCKDKVS